MPNEIVVAENFTSPTGQFTNYGSSDSVDLPHVLANEHVDIRTMCNDKLGPYFMYLLDGVLISDMESFSMGELDDELVYIPGENWQISPGLTGNFPSLTNFPSTTNWPYDLGDQYGDYFLLTIPCTSGGNTATSVPNQVWPSFSNQTTTNVDLTPMEDTDHLSVAFPSFPLSSINLSGSYLKLTSDTGGSFSDHAVSIPFTHSITTLVNGNSELRFLRMDITDGNYAVGTHPIDISAITGVQLYLTATGDCTVEVAAIRLLSAGWLNGGFDMDTRYQRLKSVVARNGSTVQDFTWPTLVRVDDSLMDGSNDPRPYNSTLRMGFHVGKKAEGSGFSLIFRDREEQIFQMVDLDTDDISTLDGQPLSNLDNSAPTIETYVKATITWGNDTSTFTIENAEDLSPIYQWTFDDLDEEQDYVLSVELEDNGFRARVFGLTATQGVITEALWDTGWNYDSFEFHRRRGRIGWLPNITATDSYIRFFNASSMMFSEYQSAQLNSWTPVDGVEFSVNSSPDNRLITGVDATKFGGTLTTDVVRVSPVNRYAVPHIGSTKITVTNTMQGFMTNPLTITNWENTYLSYDVFFSSDFLNKGGGLYMFLLSDHGNILQLPDPRPTPDQWQNITYTSLPFTIEQTGSYTLIVGVHQMTFPATWWMDNLVINDRNIAWAGRTGYRQPWLPLRDLHNIRDSGALLDRGTQLQIRGQALHQRSFINEVGIKPKYVTQGNFSWDDPLPPHSIPPIPPIPLPACNTIGRTRYFDGTRSWSPAGHSIVHWLWQFDNGWHLTGARPVMTYELAQRISLTVTDSKGRKATESFEA